MGTSLAIRTSGFGISPAAGVRDSKTAPRLADERELDQFISQQFHLAGKATAYLDVVEQCNPWYNCVGVGRLTGLVRDYLVLWGGRAKHSEGVEALKPDLLVQGLAETITRIEATVRNNTKIMEATQAFIEEKLAEADDVRRQTDEILAQSEPRNRAIREWIERQRSSSGGKEYIEPAR